MPAIASARHGYPAFSMSRSRSLLLAASVLLAGCAGLTEQECRTANWYELGERDALVYGLRPRIDQYAHQCQKFAVQPAEGEYLSGWTVGDRERAVRTLGGVCCGP